MKNCFSVLAICFIICLISCKREGCTDPDSLNYSQKAKKNDGSCRYKAQVVFWFDEETFKKFEEENQSTVIMLFNEKPYTLEIKSAGNSAPACDTTKYNTLVLDLGPQKTKVFNYQIYNRWGQLLWDENVVLQGNKCVDVKLVQ